MESLLAFLLLLFGSSASANPDITWDEIARATQQARESAMWAEQGAGQQPPDSAQASEKTDPQPDAPVVKGIYTTAHSAGGARLDTLLNLLDNTELNTLVIDIKDDWGNITYETGDPDLKAWNTSLGIIKDPVKLMETLKAHEVYPIARIVVFKDSVLAKARPELSFRNADGSLWRNGNGDAFVNPYRKEVWDYNIQVAKDAAALGFKEIQFDYVRFPEGFEKKAERLTYDADERTRIDVVADFVKHARDQLNPLGIRVSVDIFGYAASVPAAEGIGQDFQKISKNVDVICPMIYPSHYSTGWFGSKVPDATPYVTIDGAMKDTHKKLAPLEEQKLKPIVRPWIQDFTASWVKGHIRYGKHEIEEQIRALDDNGVEEFLLWNAGNRYTQGVAY